MANDWQHRIIGPTGPEFRSWSTKSIFLAGGISGCPDWQTPTAESIAMNTDPNVLIMNPRLPGTLDPTDITTAIPQIQWEYDTIRDADMVLFWFPKETLCPITLLELGKELVRAELTDHNRLIIGTEPGYGRALDVMVQSQLVFPDLEIYHSLDQMIDLVVQLHEGPVVF